MLSIRIIFAPAASASLPGAAPAAYSAPAGACAAMEGRKQFDVGDDKEYKKLAGWVRECLGGLSRREQLVFLAIAIVWVEGQAIHLATNAIGDVFSPGADRGSFYATEAGDLDHWFDEGLGHWLWHLAWAALSANRLGSNATSSVRAPK